MLCVCLCVPECGGLIRCCACSLVGTVGCFVAHPKVCLFVDVFVCVGVCLLVWLCDCVCVCLSACLCWGARGTGQAPTNKALA